MAQHGGCDVLGGTKWVANLWLTLVGEPGTDDAFKGWIDYGKDESKYKPGTDWQGKPIKTNTEGEKESSEKVEGSGEEKIEMENDEKRERSGEEKSEMKQDEENREEKEKTIKEAKESGDGSYDVKLEL